MADTTSSSSLFSAFARAPIHFERGEGVRLFTTDGTEYLDFAAGIAVNSLGHSHPELVNALAEQGQKLWHRLQTFLNVQACFLKEFVARMSRPVTLCHAP